MKKYNLLSITMLILLTNIVFSQEKPKNINQQREATLNPNKYSIKQNSIKDTAKMESISFRSMANESFEEVRTLKELKEATLNPNKQNLKNRSVIADTSKMESISFRSMSNESFEEVKTLKELKEATLNPNRYTKQRTAVQDTTKN